MTATGPAPTPSGDERYDAVHSAAFRGAVEGADAYHGVMIAVRTEGELLRVGNRFVPLEAYREIGFLAFGTAAVSQALALNDVLGERLTQGFIAGPMVPPKQLPFRSQVVAPDWPGGKGAEEARASARELAQELPERSLLLLLLSPGAMGVLSAAPPGFDAVSWRQWLADLHRHGASGAEVSRVIRVVGDGLVGGEVGRAARHAEVVTLVVERGDEASVGGGPTVPVSEEERRAVRSALQRVGATGTVPERLRSRLESDPSRPTSLPKRVSRPVVVAGPADALSGAASAVGEKRWMPRLAGLYLPGPPETVERTFVERITTMTAQYRDAVRVAKRNGLVVFAMTTFGLPEGIDERGTMAKWVGGVMARLPEPGTTVAVLRTAGGEPGNPPGLVADRTGKASGLEMPPGVTDAGVLLLARVPLGASGS